MIGLSAWCLRCREIRLSDIHVRAFACQLVLLIRTVDTTGVSNIAIGYTSEHLIGSAEVGIYESEYTFREQVRASDLQPGKHIHCQVAGTNDVQLKWKH